MRKALVGRLRDERGVGSVEMVVLAPLLIAMVLLPIQFALWWHGQQAAALAAEECVDAAQVEGVDVSAQGTAGAMAILGVAGNVSNVSISATSTGDTVTCVVTGDLDFKVVPIGGIEAEAEGPIEQFLSEVER